ncbi:NADH-quinone oxidoreductase subunit A [bacterium]|nr:NADH-quinone oxidoreductase subunit A [bacterium]
MEKYTVILAFFVFGMVFVTANLIIASILGKKISSQQKEEIYECGEPAEGDAWIRFNNRFYLVALVFLVFDVEIVLLFPWAVALNSLIESGEGILAFWAMTIFVAILVLGLAYDWIKGGLEWIKPSLLNPSYFKKETVK